MVISISREKRRIKLVPNVSTVWTLLVVKLSLQLQSPPEFLNLCPQTQLSSFMRVVYLIYARLHDWATLWVKRVKQ